MSRRSIDLDTAWSLLESFVSHKRIFWVVFESQKTQHEKLKNQLYETIAKYENMMMEVTKESDKQIIMATLFTLNEQLAKIIRKQR